MAEDDKRSKEKLEETRRVKGEVGEDKADHDERPEKKLEAAGWKSMVELLISWALPWNRRDCQLNRGETTTTGICPAISGATQNSPCFECSRLVDLSLLNLAHSSPQPPLR